MPIQVLPSGKNFASEFGAVLGSGIGGGVSKGFSESIERSQNLRGLKQKSENEERQLMLKSGLQGRNQQQLENLRQKGKEDILKNKQNYVSQLLGEESPQENEISDQLNSKTKEKKSFDPLSLSDEIIAKATILDPNLGKSLRDSKNAKIEQNLQKRKENIEFHKESQKYDEDLAKNTKIAKNQASSVESIGKAISSGNVNPSSWANIFKGWGEVGDKISNAVLNKDEATLLASIPALLEGWKEVFGVRLSDADLKVLQDKLPSIGKTPESNKSILNIMRKYSDMTLLRSKIASDIKKKNGGLRPLGYSDLVEERFDEMVKPIAIINPHNGKRIEIPAYEVGDAISSGARLADE